MCSLISDLSFPWHRDAALHSCTTTVAALLDRRDLPHSSFCLSEWRFSSGSLRFPRERQRQSLPLGTGAQAAVGAYYLYSSCVLHTESAQRRIKRRLKSLQDGAHDHSACHNVPPVCLPACRLPPPPSSESSCCVCAVQYSTTAHAPNYNSWIALSARPARYSQLC